MPRIHSFACLSALLHSGCAQTTQSWRNLNTSVEGRLHTLAPLALPCFSQHNGQSVGIDEIACDVVRNNYTVNAFRSTRPNGFTFLQNEICLGDETDQCLLDNTNEIIPKPRDGTSCNQGSVPSWYIEVQKSSDVAAAFDFARGHDVPLTIKNSGHDMLTRNSQKGGLSLWVGQLQDKEYHDDFVPEGCQDGESVRRAMTAGTGSSTTSIHEFLSEHDSTFVGGFSGTVASSGGWIQGGGHSILSPVFGMGVDRVVQFRIVTPDGELRTANKCQNQDLFWALRGGGGGTFGVVLDATHRVEPAAPVVWAMIELPESSADDTVLDWLELQARESLKWGREGWGGHVGGLFLRRVNPIAPIADLNDGGAAVRKSLQKAVDFALAHNGTVTIEVLSTFYDVYQKYINPGGLENSGATRFMSTRLVPQTMFQDDEGITEIMDYVKEVSDLGFAPRDFYIAVGSPYVADVSRDEGLQCQGETSIHPAWYSALWQVATRFELSWNATRAERVDQFATLGQSTLVQEKLTGPEGATYGLEANPFTTNWQKSWWGPNYERLLAITEKYDPEGLLNCWKCVGFEDKDMDSERYQCNGRLQRAIDEALDETEK